MGDKGRKLVSQRQQILSQLLIAPLIFVGRPSDLHMCFLGLPNPTNNSVS